MTTKQKLNPHDLAKWRQAAINKELAEGAARALLAEIFLSYSLDRNCQYIIEWDGEIVTKVQNDAT